MTTDTALRETRAYPTRGGILADFPQWAYLPDPAAVRPPTEDETAKYAVRAADPEWAWLYDLASRPAPSPPSITALPSLPVAGNLEPLPAGPSETAADKAQADSEAALARWGVTETIPAAEAAESEGEK